VTRVYVDVGAVEVEGGGIATSVDSAAVRALRLLADGEHEVVLVSPAGRKPSGELTALARAVVAAVPGRPVAASWYLTADVERCHGTSARLRTVLIGAAPPAGSIRRCDGTARDVQTAVLEILAAEAMPTTG
jgi:hypothetical protein